MGHNVGHETSWGIISWSPGTSHDAVGDLLWPASFRRWTEWHGTICRLLSVIDRAYFHLSITRYSCLSFSASIVSFMQISRSRFFLFCFNHTVFALLRVWQPLSPLRLRAGRLDGGAPLLLPIVPFPDHAFLSATRTMSSGSANIQAASTSVEV